MQMSFEIKRIWLYSIKKVHGEPIYKEKHVLVNVVNDSEDQGNIADFDQEGNGELVDEE